MIDATPMKWQEPWFFSMRMRDRRGWRRKGWLVLAIFAAMMIGWYFDQKFGKALQIGILGGSLFSFGTAIFVGFLSDLTLAQVSINNTGVIRMTYGHGIGASLWRYDEISRFAFIPCETSGKPFGLLFLIMKANIVSIGVPSSVSGTELAKILRSCGVQEAEAQITET